MNDKKIQEMFDRFLNRHGVLNEFYAAFIRWYGVDESLIDIIKIKKSTIIARASDWGLYDVKWTALSELWKQELRRNRL